MNHYSPWQPDIFKTLSRGELRTVLADLDEKAGKSASARLNRVIFRLAACCGLRVSEISGIRMGDVILSTARPHLVIRREVAKGGTMRRVPLWWDAATLEVLRQWYRERVDQGVTAGDPFVCSPRAGQRNRSVGRHTLRRRFLTACKCLGMERLRTLTIHHGRHTFISHALAGGRTLAEVRAAAGHASLVTTSGYLHIVDDDAVEGRLFG